MLRGFGLLTGLLLVVLVPQGAPALERQSAPVPAGLMEDSWATGSTCTVSYFNVCTGWMWVWQLDPSELVGIPLESCCESEEAPASHAYAHLRLVGCSGGLRVHVPGHHRRGRFQRMSGPQLSTRHVAFPAGVGVEQSVLGHSSATGVRDVRVGELLSRKRVDSQRPPECRPHRSPACGTCLPSSRTTYATRYGTRNSILCPGEPLNDGGGTCNAALFVQAIFLCPGPVSAEAISWGQIKALYR